MIHGPSLGIGAGIAAAIIIGALFVVNGSFQDISFKKEDIRDIQKSTANTENSDTQAPQKLQMSVLYENSSPILGDPNAPITIVEFGDYQCFFCNKFFHEIGRAHV